MNGTTTCRVCQRSTPTDQLVYLPARNHGPKLCVDCATVDLAGDSEREQFKRRGLPICPEGRPESSGGVWKMIR